jgi:superfamily II DNA/RNA helicase
VIDFDAPEDRAGYVHRVGRAGRRGVGVTLGNELAKSGLAPTVSGTARRREGRR